MNERIITAKWSPVMNLEDARKSSQANQSGVYLWFVRSGGRSRIIYVGAAPSATLMARLYTYTSYGVPGNRDHFSFDLQRMGDCDIYSHICHGRLKEAHKNGLFFWGGEKPDRPPLEVDEIRSYFIEHLRISLANIKVEHEPDTPSNPKMSLKHAILDTEEILRRHVKKYGIDDYNKGSSPLGKREGDDNRIAMTILKNTFPQECCDWFADLDSEIKGQNLAR